MANTKKKTNPKKTTNNKHHTGPRHNPGAISALCLIMTLYADDKYIDSDNGKYKKKDKSKKNHQ